MAAPRGYRASSYGWDAHYDATQYDHEDYMTYDNWQLKLEQGDAPTDMVVDGLYPEVEKDDVAIIDPDQLDSTDIEMPDRLRADDCMYILLYPYATALILFFRRGHEGCGSTYPCRGAGNSCRCYPYMAYQRLATSPKEGAWSGL